MVHLLIAFKRKAGLSREEFSHHWREVHAPLGKKYRGYGVTLKIIVRQP